MKKRIPVIDISRRYQDRRSEGGWTTISFSTSAYLAERIAERATNENKTKSRVVSEILTGEAEPIYLKKPIDKQQNKE